MAPHSPNSWTRWRRILADTPLPAAVVDLDALDHNLDLLCNATSKPSTVRIASKSLRVPWLFRYLQQRGGARIQGLMTYDPRETAWLAGSGFDDMLLAYPIGRPSEATMLAKLAAEGVTLRATLDHPDHVALLGQAAQQADTTIHVCIDIDASLRPLGGRAHLGVRRSPIRSPESALKLARVIRDTPGVQLDALLAYEAQIAGLRDHNPTSRLLDPVRRTIKALSRPEVRRRRRAILDALRADGHPITLFNGGGTGSVRFTSRDPTVTEVTAGSGFVCSHLFDGYHDLPLRPALLFAIGIVRRSDPDFVTCAGGGYVASGEAGSDRLPIIHLPVGLTPIDLEGFGEVQTPLQVGPQAPPLAIGDPVLCRHAKAGELAERFDHYLMVRGDEVEAVASTYRGLGQCFI